MVTTALVDADIDHLLIEEASGRDAVVVEIPVSGGGVEPVLDLLYERVSNSPTSPRATTRARCSAAR